MILGFSTSRENSNEGILYWWRGFEWWNYPGRLGFLIRCLTDFKLGSNSMKFGLGFKDQIRVNSSWVKFGLGFFNPRFGHFGNHDHDHDN